MASHGCLSVSSALFLSLSALAPFFSAPPTHTLGVPASSGCASSSTVSVEALWRV